MSKGTKINFHDVKVGQEIAVYDLIPRNSGRGRDKNKNVGVDKRLRASGTVARRNNIGGMTEFIDPLGNTLVSSLSDRVKIELL